MVYSNIALKILAAKECGYIRTNNQFWKDFSNLEDIEKLFVEHFDISIKCDELKKQFEAVEYQKLGMICVFDEDFPCINPNAKNSEKPYLLFYKGQRKLLENLNNNVAVIGLTDPTPEIEKRERRIVEKLLDCELNIVSGLAKGCDEIAHRVCVEKHAKTIAILPTDLNNIAPRKNRELADSIVESGGLLLTEYFKDADNKYEAVARYIERDRLQAMFSKAVILIASYKKGEGDSGSRHAMEYAQKFGIKRYVMFNFETDSNDIQFGLNREYKTIESVDIITPTQIQFIKSINNEFLSKKVITDIKQQKITGI